MRMTEKEREEGGETWRNLIFIAPGDFSCLQVCFCLSVSFSISIMLFLSMLQYLPELNIACLLSSVSPSSFKRGEEIQDTQKTRTVSCDLQFESYSTLLGSSLL